MAQICDNLRKSAGTAIAFTILFTIVAGLGGCNFLTTEVKPELATDSGNDDNPMVVSDGDTGLALLLCLEAKGARMFGSYTCGHCANQKKSLGDKALPEFDRIYVECNPRAEDNDRWACIENGIEVFPTWIFADGAVRRGFTEPAKLQELSGCTDEELKKY